MLQHIIKPLSKTSTAFLILIFALSCSAPPEPHLRKQTFSSSHSTLKIAEFSGTTHPVRVSSGSTVEVSLTLLDDQGKPGSTFDPIHFYLGEGGSTGSFSPMIDNGNGKITSEFKGLVSGHPVELHAKVGTQEITSVLPLIQVDPGPASPTESLVTVSAPTVEAGSTVIVRAELRDANQNKIRTGNLVPRPVFILVNQQGGTGKFSAIIDEGNGNYSSQFQGLMAGTNQIQVRLNESLGPPRATIQVVPAAFSAEKSSVSVASSTVQSGKRVQVNIKTTDSYGNFVPSPGKTIYLSSSSTTSNPSTLRIDPIVTQESGSYTSWLTGINAAEPIQVKAEIDSIDGLSRIPLGTKNPSLQVIPGPISSDQSEIIIPSGKVNPGSFVLVKVILRDENKNPFSQDDGARNVTFNYSTGAGIGTGKFQTARHEGQGVYSALFEAENDGALPGTLSVVVDGKLITSSAPQFVIEPLVFFGIARENKKRAAVETRKFLSNEEPTFSRPESETDYSKDLKHCAANYAQQWPKTLQSVNTLKSTSACWNGEQKLEIKKLAESIHLELDHILSQKSKEITGKIEDANAEIRAHLFSLGRHYQEVQEHLSYCRLKDVLPISTRAMITASGEIPPVAESIKEDQFGAFEDKALLHVVGDTFGQKSGLEGQTIQEYLLLLERRIGIIESIQSALKANHYILTQEQADPCRAILGGFHPDATGHHPPRIDFDLNELQSIIDHAKQAKQLTETFYASLPKFADQLTKNVRALKNKGDWLYFSGGTIDHAVIYRIIKDGPDLITFRIYNSGDGLQFHEGVLDGTTKLAYPYVEIAQVKIASLLRISFLKSLRDLMIQKDGLNSQTAYLYDNLLPELGGVRTTFSPRLEDFLVPQLAGNCTYYVLPFMETSIFGEKQELRPSQEKSPTDHFESGAFLEFFIKSRILDAYFTVNEQRIKKYESVQTLAQRTLTFYSEEIARNLSEINPRSASVKTRYLDWGVARESSERIKRYQGMVNLADDERKKLAQSQTPTLSHALSSILTNGHDGYLNRRFPSIREKQNEKSDLSALEIEDWKATPHSVDRDLVGWIKKIQPVTEEKTQSRPQEIAKIIEAVPDLVLKLPLDLPFYQELTKQQLSAILGLLSELSQQHLWALVNSHKDPTSNKLGLSPISVLAQIKILTLADQTIRLYGKYDPTYSNFPSLYHSFFKFLITPHHLKSEDPEATSIWQDQQWAALWMIEDQHWQEDFKHLVDYWTRRIPEKTNYDPIFQWDNMPLYSSSPYQSKHRYIQKYRHKTEFHWSDSWNGPPGGGHPVWNDVAWSLNAQRNGTKNENSIAKALHALDHQTPSKNRLSDEFFEVRDISFITHFILMGSFDSEMLQHAGLTALFGNTRWFSEKNHGERISQVVNMTTRQELDYRNIPNEYFTQTLNFFNEKFNNINQSTLVQKYNEGILIYQGGDSGSLGLKYDNRYFLGNPHLGLMLGGDRNRINPWNEILHSRESYYQPGAGRIPIDYLGRLNSFEIVARPQALIQVPFKKNPGTTKAVGMTTLEMQRYLLNLGSPLVTLGFFQEHPDYLREKKWQTIFKSMMFQPRLLVAEVKQTPHLKRLLTDFCISNFEKKLKDEEYLTAAFFARMLQLVEEFIPRKDQNNDFGLSRMKLKAVLAKLTNPVSDSKNLILRDVLRTYRFQNFKILNEDEIALYLEAVLYRDRNPLSDFEEFFDADEEHAVSGVYLKRRAALESRMVSLAPEKINELLNRVVKYFNPADSGQLIWTKKPGVSVGPAWEGKAAGAETVELDLTLPRIYVGNQEQKTLPGVIAAFPKFKENVTWSSEGNPYAKWLGDQRYELVDLKDHKRVRVDASVNSAESSQTSQVTSFKIEKQWGNHWYQLLDDSTVNAMAIDGGTQNWSVTPGYKNWQSVSNQVSIPSSRAYRESADFPPSELVKWQQISPERGGIETLAFRQDPVTFKTQLYSVSRTRGHELIVQKVTECRGIPEVNGTTLYHNLIPKTDSLADEEQESNPPVIEALNEATLGSLLARIEIPRMIWIWQKPGQDQSVEEIEFPRFDITFRNKNGKLISPELESYALSENQVYPGLSHYPHYLILEKGTDKKRIIVPKFRFVSRGLKQKGLITHYDLNWLARSPIDEKNQPEAIHHYARKSQKFLIWTVDPFSNELRLTDSSDRFYRAMIHLWGHTATLSSYDLARELLYGTRSNLNDFREDLTDSLHSGAREILDWIMKLENQDHDPRSIALQLGAGFLVLENDLINHRYTTSQNKTQLGETIVPELIEKDKDWKLLEKKYNYFLNTRERISTRWLPEDLERLFLRETIAAKIKLGEETDPRMTIRLAELRGGSTEIYPIASVRAASFNSFTTFNYNSLKEIISRADYNFDCTPNENIFLGIPALIQELYEAARSLSAIDINSGDLNSSSQTKIEPAIIQTLANILGVPLDVLHSQSDSQLKEEFLSLLRLQIRQRTIELRKEDSSQLTESCRSRAEFLYVIASSPSGRVLPDWNTLKSIFNPTLSWDLTYQSRAAILDKLVDQGNDYISRSKINSVSGSFLKSEHPISLLPSGIQSQSPRFWDPRPPRADPPVPLNRESNLEEEQKYENYNLIEAPVIRHEDLEPIIHKRQLTCEEAIEPSNLAMATKSNTNKRLQNTFDFIPLESKIDESNHRYDPFIHEKLKGIKKSLTRDLNRDTYEWTRADSSSAEVGLENLRVSVNKEIHRSKIDVDEIEKDIYQTLLEFPKNPWAKSKETIFRASEVELKQNLKDLLREYTKGSLSDSYFASNPAFGVERINRLSKRLTSYLLVSTYHFRAQETMNALNQVIALVKALPSKSSLNHEFAAEEIKRLYQTASALRAYKIEEHPDYLVFEYMMRQLIRKDQVNNLGILTGDDPGILEMIPGAGKTSVLLPLASHKSSVKNKTLSIVILPEALVPSMAKQLGSQLAEVFGQGVDRMTILRRHRYDAAKLEYLEMRLKRDLDEGRVLVTSNSSIQSLFLIFIESLYEYQKLNTQDEKEARKREIEILQEIFSLFRVFPVITG